MLTDFALRNLKSGATPYKAADRDGMYAAISPKGAISFVSVRSSPIDEAVKDQVSMV